jgi:hypothetical protein
MRIREVVRVTGLDRTRLAESDTLSHVLTPKIDYVLSVSHLDTRVT